MNDLNEEVKLLLAQGKKIHAIKFVMNETERSLKEAKRYVDEIERHGHPVTANSPASPITDDVLEAEAASYLAKKNKIGAIKRVRELTSWGLKEAKNYVDMLERRGTYNVTNVQPQMISDETLAFEARQYLKPGNKVMAVKRVRELTGWGLKEAKEFVDRL